MRPYTVFTARSIYRTARRSTLVLQPRRSLFRLCEIVVPCRVRIDAVYLDLHVCTENDEIQKL